MASLKSVELEQLESAGRRVLLRTAFVLLISFLVVKSIFAVYNAWFGPLSRFPGPVIRKFSKIPLAVQRFRGHDGTITQDLHHRYGPVVRIAPRVLSFIGTPQTWKDIYGRKPAQGNVVKDPFFYVQRPGEAHDLIIAGEADHSRQRRVFSHAFSDKALKEQEPLLKRWACLLREKLAEKADTGERVDMVKMLNCTTFDIMGDFTFSEPLFMLENSEYVPWVRTIFGNIKDFSRLIALKISSRALEVFVDKVIFRLPFVEAQRQEHLAFTNARVQRRLAKTIDSSDLFSRILQKDNDPEGLTRKEADVNAALLMTAGTETTATALSGTLYYLLRNPEKMKKLKEELKGSFARTEDLTLEAAARRIYMEAVLKEGLRMYPPLPTTLPRIVASGGASIAGQYVPEGTSIGIPHYATYRHPASWRDPDAFWPERWLGDSDDVKGALEPFSVGYRNCLGMNFAWHEMRFLLVTVLIHFDLSLCEASARWADQKMFLLWEKAPLWCELSIVRQDQLEAIVQEK